MSASASHRRAVFAARFLKPPGYYKRAEMREKPRIRTGPFENPVRRFVRLREKARQFCEIPPPRKIPIPKPVSKNFLKSIEGVPKVDPEVLQRRLEFLLSKSAADQQLAAPMRAGHTPFQVELFVWERQMRDLRKIYRAQYLQKLAEVTEEERAKQMQLYMQEREERFKRKEEIRQRLFEDRKRRAILRDRRRIEGKVSEAVELTRLSRRKKKQLLFLDKLERSPATRFMTVERAEALLSKDAEVAPEDDILNRNISMPDLLRQLGKSNEVARIYQKKIHGTQNVFREILEASYALLPEDEPQFEPDTSLTGPASGTLTHRQRAQVMYSGFSEDEKLKLLDEKIKMLQEKLDQNATNSVGTNTLLYSQLLDQLEAAKYAYLEKRENEKARQEAAKSRESV